MLQLKVDKGIGLRPLDRTFLEKKKMMLMFTKECLQKQITIKHQHGETSSYA